LPFAILNYSLLYRQCLRTACLCYQISLNRLRLSVDYIGSLTPTPTPVDTTGSSSGSGTSSAAQQQAANEAKDQSLMAQSNAPTATATSPTADPSQCGTIEAQEQSAIAPLAAQIKQLETSIQGEYAAITGPEAYTGQAAATIDSEIQTQENQVNSDISKINTIETPYSQQLGYNGCG
jgi:hypothetical protein